MSRRPQNGFTIIEIMIVLAIGGFIMLLVFLAIPTLTRSQRNSDRRTGAGSVMSAVLHYELSHGGLFPPSCDGNCTDLSLSPGVFYDTSHITICSGSYANGGLKFCDGSTGDQPATTDIDHVYIYNYQRCNSAVLGGGASSGAGYSDIVAIYALESGGSTNYSQCQEQ